MDVTAMAVTIGGVALMVLTLWFFFGKPKETRSTKGGAVYSCPMHPWITSSDPAADCSICGMKLVRDEGGNNPAG